MPYALLFDKPAIKAMKKLPKEIRKRIFEKLQKAKENPFHYFERLKGRLDYKLKVGDYRTIADIKRDEQRIEVTLAGHRSTIYERLKRLKP
jgi:mRNA interferase RelE/StbE